MKTAHYVVGALAASALLLTSCSSSSSPAPASSSAALAASSSTASVAATVAPLAVAAGAVKDPCTLAGSADVTTAFGGKAAAGAGNTAHSKCTWHVVGASFGTDCDVTVAIPAFPDDQATFDQNKAQGGKAPTVPGVGDDAYQPEQGKPNLQFRKGNSIAEVDLDCTSDPDDAKELAAVVTLAKSVVVKL